MQYDQRENHGKFQPNVNYNVPILQLPQRKEINRPDIAYGSSSGLKLSDNSTEIAKAAQAAREEEYNQGLNDYARKVNEIAEGQRQGNYDVSTAEMYTRQLDDQYLRNGFYAKDLYKIRNQYDGGVRKIEEERQQQMVKHEQERRLKYLDTFRQEYNMPTATDEEIEALTTNIDNLMKATKMYQSYVARSDLTQDEREAYMAVAGVHGKQLDAVQGVLTLYGIVNDPKFEKEDLTPQLKETLMKQMRDTLHDKIGVGFREANMIADKVMEESGLGYAFSKELKDLNASNEYIKTGIEQMMNTTKYGMLQDNPDLRAAMILGEGLTTFAAGEKAQFLINAVNGISRYTEGLTPDIDPNTAVEASNLIFNNQHQPTKILDDTFQNTANIVEKTIQDPKTLDRSALDIQLKNINGALEYVNDKSKLARLSKDVPVQEIADKLVYHKAATEGAKFALDHVNDLQKDMDALMDSFQAGRLSIDESGSIRLNKETTGKMSWLGDALGYEGTRQQIERINTAMEGMSAPARAAALEQMSGGRLRAVGMNEKLVNTTSPTIRGQVKNWLTQAGTDIMTGVTVSPQGVLDTTKDLAIGGVQMAVANKAMDAGTKVIGDRKAGGEIMKNVMLDEAAQNSASGLDSFLDTGLAYIKDQFFPEAEDMPIDSAQLKKELDAKMPQMIEEYKKSAEKGNKSIERTSAELMDIVKKRMDSLGYTPKSLQLRKELSENYDKFQEAMKESIQIEILKAKLEDTYREEKELYETGFKKIDEKYDAARLADEMNKIETPLFTGEETTTSSKVSNKTTLSNAFVEAKPAVEGYNEFIQQSAANHGVDPRYLDMIAAIESKRGKYTHASSAGAKGVMQFMPKTWREEIMPVFGFSEKDINDPQKSIEAGAWYIKQCEKYAKSIKPDADAQESAEIQAACYNAGAGNVNKAIERAGGDWERAKEYLADETKNYINYVRQFYNATDPYNDRDFVAEDRNKEVEEEALIQELQDTIRSEKIASGDASVEEFLEDWLKRFRNRKSIARTRIHAAAEARKK